MGLIEYLKRSMCDLKHKNVIEDEWCEFCPRCEANLTLQKGYHNDLLYWICKGCGEMLINPKITDDIIWRCDKCSSVLNVQDGFDGNRGEWKCVECGYLNKIDNSQIYISDDEYRNALQNPYRGMDDASVIELMGYSEVESLKEDDSVILVKNLYDDKLYVKKNLQIYDLSIYHYLMEHPIKHMPRLMGIYEGDNYLILIEEYIDGMTLLEMLSDKNFDEKYAAHIVRSVASIVLELHSLNTPIIHRDIKPSNIIISKEGEVFLLDINVAKWYQPEETEDTKLLGTLYFAAPEQMGFGFSASTTKTDIYALGILLNIMITGKLPKEKRASGNIWKIIERCICLEAEDRFTDEELIDALTDFMR